MKIYPCIKNQTGLAFIRTALVVLGLFLLGYTPCAYSDASRASATVISPHVPITDRYSNQAKYTWTPQEIHQLLVAVRKQTGVPAIACAFVTAQHVVSDSVGALRNDKPDPVSQDSLFALGSASKAITATLAAVLVEKGKLRWNSTVSELFPDFAAEISPALKNVTLTQLLSHRAGLPAFTTPTDIAGASTLIGTAREQRHQFAKQILTQTPAFPMGSWHYSDAGYSIAGAMLESAAGDSYEYLLNSRLMQPLDLELAFGPPAFNDPNQPWGHDEDAHQKLTAHDPNDTDLSPSHTVSALTPAWAVTMNVRDFARFAQLHLRGLLGLQTLLRPITIERLHTPPGGLLPGASGDMHYALGWFVLNLHGVTVWFHTGAEEGRFASILVVIPSRGIAAVALTNGGAGALGTMALSRVMEQLLSLKIPIDLRF